MKFDDEPTGRSEVIRAEDLELDLPQGSETPHPVARPESVPESGDFSEYALALVLQERIRQDGKWGVSRNLHPQLWLPVLMEEVGEVCEAVLKGKPDEYQAEMVHVAAVALAAIQDFLWQKQYRADLPKEQVEAFGWERAMGRPAASPAAPSPDSPS